MHRGHSLKTNRQDAKGAKFTKNIWAVKNLNQARQGFPKSLPNHQTPSSLQEIVSCFAFLAVLGDLAVSFAGADHKTVTSCSLRQTEKATEHRRLY